MTSKQHSRELGAGIRVRTIEVSREDFRLELPVDLPRVESDAHRLEMQQVRRERELQLARIGLWVARICKALLFAAWSLAILWILWGQR